MGWKSRLRWLVVLVLLGIAGVLFAPARLGGDMYYVMLTGPSMEPNFHVGDLVLVRRAAYYQPGDIVLYRHPDIGYVFHRIVGFDLQGHYRLQGDNNTWEDPYHPTRDEILGQFVLRIPKAGEVLQAARRPWVITLLVVLLGWLLLTVPEDVEQNELRRLPMFQNETLKDWLLIWAVFLLAALVLGVMAFTHPQTVEVQEPIPYRQIVDFAYTAQAPEGLYDQPQVQPGEPIFTELTGTLRVSARYSWAADAPYHIRGTYQMLARISDNTGWKRTVHLTPVTPFEQGFSVQSVVDLQTLEAFVKILEEATGIRRSTYTLSVVLHVEAQGVVGGSPVHVISEPALNFQWDGRALVLLAPENGPGKPTSDPFHWVQESMIVREATHINQLTILGMKMPVPLARQISVAVGGLALVLLLVTWRKAESRAAVDPVARLQWVFDVAVVPVETVPPFELPLVPVASLDDLGKLAALRHLPVFVWQEHGQQRLWVQTPEAVYYYETGVLTPTWRPQSLTVSPKRILPRRAATAFSCEPLLEGWAQAVDVQSVGDPAHSRRVAALAVALGRLMGLSEASLANLRRAALIHGLGLMNLPFEIVRKPGFLNEEERERLQAHVRYLEIRLGTLNDLRPALRIAYYHHERWDGSGYPEGLSGKEIPLEARILAVADVWDSLRHPRPYRSAWPFETGRQFMQQKAGLWFDPQVVDALLTLLKDERDEQRLWRPMETEVSDEKLASLGA